MVVQHNLTAMNSNRMLGITAGTQAKSTEKLSSGYKINRAADDAAGLSISEKMRKQIRGLTQASTNAQDGISAVQTAEGALNEVQDMLQRMNELAVKAANGTNSEDDRSYIQNEIDQLTTEISRVAETTKFNETYLLKGDRDVADYRFSYATAAAEETSEAEETSDSETSTVNLFADEDALKDALRSGSAIVNSDGEAVDTDGWYTAATDAVYEAADSTYDSSTQYYTKNGDDYEAATVADQSELDSGEFYTLTSSANPEAFNIPAETDATTLGTASAAEEAGETESAEAEASVQYYDKDGNKIPANALDNIFEFKDGAVAVKNGAKTVYDKAGNVIKPKAEDVTEEKLTSGALTLKLHVGADATENNQIGIDIKAMSAEGLGVDGLKVDGKDDTNALAAIDTIKEAIQKVSTQRSALGAVQNRLEHTINNLDNVVENTTSAESTIRDTDMASEMVKYSNNNILAQAGQAMLAQANQSNQGVLSLLG